MRDILFLLVELTAASSDYELEFSKYIHLNPMKANMAKRLEEYPCSYPVYIKLVNSSSVTTKQILFYFPELQAHLD
jgi:putative transposase